MSHHLVHLPTGEMSPESRPPEAEASIEAASRRPRPGVGDRSAPRAAGLDSSSSSGADELRPADSEPGLCVSAGSNVSAVFPEACACARVRVRDI